MADRSQYLAAALQAMGDQMKQQPQTSPMGTGMNLGSLAMLQAAARRQPGQLMPSDVGGHSLGGGLAAQGAPNMQMQPTGVMPLNPGMGGGGYQGPGQPGGLSQHMGQMMHPNRPNMPGPGGATGQMPMGLGQSMQLNIPQSVGAIGQAPNMGAPQGMGGGMPNIGSLSALSRMNGGF